jgi:hypothetical protein
VQQSTETPVTKTPSQTLEESECGLVLAELMKALEEIDLNSPTAKLNETTMSDNNGGRIWL